MGAAESVPHTTAAVSTPTASATGGGWIEGPPSAQDANAITRGLLNPDLAHHCFLNTVVQLLFHTHGFRQAILEGAKALPHSHADPSEVCLTCALRSLFTFYQHGAQGIALSVDALRGSLNAIYGKRGDDRFAWSSLADVGETLEAMLAVLHQEHLNAAGLLTDSDRAKPLGELLDKSCETTFEGRKLACPAHECFSLSVLSWLVCPSCSIPSEPSVGSALAYLVNCTDATAALQAFEDFASRRKAEAVLSRYQQQQQQQHQSQSSHWGGGRLGLGHHFPWPHHHRHDAAAPDEESASTAAAILSTPPLIARDDPAFFRGVGEIPPSAALSPREHGPDPALTLGALLSFMAAREASAEAAPALLTSPLPRRSTAASSAAMINHRTRSDLSSAAIEAAKKRPHTIPSDPDEFGRRCTDSRGVPERILLHLPRVFAVSIIWPSDSASRQEVASLMALISPQLLDLRQLFRLENDLTTDNSGKTNAAAAGSSLYRLKGLSLFYGKHWVSIVASDRHKAWLLIDDTKISPLIDPATGESSFNAVTAKVVASRYQPTVIIYEQLKPPSSSSSSSTTAPAPWSGTPSSSSSSSSSSSHHHTGVPFSREVGAGSAPVPVPLPPPQASAAAAITITTPDLLHFPPQQQVQQRAALPFPSTYNPNAYTAAINSRASASAAAASAARAAAAPATSSSLAQPLGLMKGPHEDVVPVSLHHHAAAAVAAVADSGASGGSAAAPPPPRALGIGPDARSMLARSPSPSSEGSGSEAASGSASSSYRPYPLILQLPLNACVSLLQAAGGDIGEAVSMDRTLGIHLQKKSTRKKKEGDQSEGKHHGEEAEEEEEEGVGIADVAFSRSTLAELTPPSASSSASGTRILPPSHPLRCLMTEKVAAAAAAGASGGGASSSPASTCDRLLSVNGRSVDSAEAADEALRDLVLNAIIERGGNSGGGGEAERGAGKGGQDGVPMLTVPLTIARRCKTAGGEA